MALSYLFATIGIVLFVELLVTKVVVPRLSSSTDVSAAALETAQRLAKASGLGNGVRDVGAVLGDQGAKVTPGETRLSGGTVVVPAIERDGPTKQPVSVAVLTDETGTIIASSFPARFPLKGLATELFAKDASNTLAKATAAHDPTLSLAAVSFRGTDRVAWSIVGIGSKVKGGAPVGYAYVETPTATNAHPFRVSTMAAVVAFTLPVGIAFGLLSTRNLRRRLRGLAAASAAVADGDFTPRVSPASSDELGALERNFNEMAERLSAATEHERELAGQNARLAERTRISRELHDSLSQDLFSLNLLVGGLRQALPADSPLQPRVERVHETVVNAVQELRALLLDLHPSALSEKGLVPALTDLCASYRARLGMTVDTDLASVPLDAAAEHAVLRIAQECLTNAAKHADAEHVTVQLQLVGGNVELMVTDDGSGFDPAAIDGSGLGLRLMRERVEELNGSVTITSASGHGTSVRVRLPAPAPTLPPPTERPVELVP